VGATGDYAAIECSFALLQNNVFEGHKLLRARATQISHHPMDRADVPQQTPTNRVRAFDTSRDCNKNDLTGQTGHVTNSVTKTCTEPLLFGKLDPHAGFPPRVESVLIAFLGRITVARGSIGSSPKGLS
jgi:hypothetical protein